MTGENDSKHDKTLQEKLEPREVRAEKVTVHEVRVAPKKIGWHGNAVVHRHLRD